MKKLWRILLVSGGVLLSLLLLIVLAVTIFLPTDHIRQRAEAEVVKATGAEVSIGNVGVNWWPQLGLSLDDFVIKGQGAELARIHGSANELGPYAANLEHFVVLLELRPLLKKEVEVAAIEVRGLDLDLVFQGKPYLVKDADLDVHDLQISMAAAQGAGKAQSGAAKLPVGEMIPEDLVLAFKGFAPSFSAQEIPLVDVKFQGDLDARILTIESITAGLGTGQLEGNLEIDYERDPRGYLDFEASATAVPAAALLQPWAPVLGEKLETDLGGSIRGNCLLGEKEEIHRTLALHGNLGSAEGVLWAKQWLGDIAPYLGARQDLMDIHFRNISHKLHLEKGRYFVDKLEIDGLETHWQGAGSVGLDGTLDMDMKVKLPTGFTPELGNLSFLADTLRDPEGRMNLDLSLSGKAAKPQVGINLGSLQDAAGSDAGDSLKKGLGGLLDKWKNR